MDTETDSLNTPLHVAARDGCLADLTRLLQGISVDVNAKNSKGWTPLHHAVETGRPSVVEVLLKHGAKIYVKDKDKTTPFQLAVRKGLADIVEMLVYFIENAERMARSQSIGSEDSQFFSFSEFMQPSKIVQSSCILRRTDWQAIRKYENPVIVSKTVLRSCDIEMNRIIVRSAHAALGMTFGTQKYQIKPGDVQYDIDPVDREEIMPFTVTVRTKDEPSNMLRRECFKALLYSLGQGLANVSVLRTLLKANVIDGHETTTRDGFTALHIAAKNKSSEVIEILLDSGKYNVNALSPKSETPLFFAVEHRLDHSSSIEELEAFNQSLKEIQSRVLLLLKHKADINARNWKGETPLMRAAEHGCHQIAQLFVNWAKANDFVIDLNASDFLGETALLKAVKNRHPETVKVLKDADASVTVADHCGHTALHKALYEVLTPDDCINIRYIWKELFNGNLQTYRQVSVDETLQKALVESLSDEDSDYFVYLLKELNDGNLTDRPDNQKTKRRKLSNRYIQGMSEDCSPETEEELNKSRIIAMILEHGDTDINAVDFRGNTPLDLSLKSGVKTRINTIETLKQYGAICKSFVFIPLDEKLGLRECVLDKRGRSAFHRLAIAYKLRPIDATRTRDYNQLSTLLDGIRWFSQLQIDKCKIVEIKDHQGRTALHKAIMPTSFSCDLLPEETMRPLICIADILLKMGCSVNAIDNYGRSPLHYSPAGPYADLFIENGADKDIRDIDGISATEMVQIRKEEEGTTRKFDDRGFAQYMNDRVVLISDIVELLQIDSSMLESMNFRYGSYPYISNEKSDYAMEILDTIMKKANFAQRNSIFYLLNREMNNFIDRLVDGIKNYDSRFECRPIFVGSAFEETKINFPDEYDFDLILTKFSDLCEVLPSPELPTGFVHLKKKQGKDILITNLKVNDFFNAEGILLTNRVNAQFKLVLGEVLEDPRFLDNEHLFEIDWRCDNDFNDPGFNGLNKNGLCTNLRLTLNRPLEGHYLFKEISVDIVPCIHIDDWWPEAALPGIRDDLKVDGCNLVFDQPHRKYPWTPFTDPSARISFAPIESLRVKESAWIAKLAYMVGKQLIKSSGGQTYILKTCFLYCNEALDPLHEKRTGRPFYKATSGDQLNFLYSSSDILRFVELRIWVETLLKCYLDFILQDFCPCYMMPTFVLPLSDYLKSNHMKLLSCEGFSDRRSIYTEDFEVIYHLYHSIALDETELSLELPKPEPLLERFNREELMEKLAALGSYSRKNQQLLRRMSFFLSCHETLIKALRDNAEEREMDADEEEEQSGESSDEYYNDYESD